MSFDPERIARQSFVQTVEYHRELSSTNDLAIELLDGDFSTPLLVLCEHQTAGRGRGENTWQSTAGALTFSVVLNPAQLAIEDDIRLWYAAYSRAEYALVLVAAPAQVKGKVSVPGRDHIAFRRKIPIVFP